MTSPGPREVVARQRLPVEPPANRDLLDYWSRFRLSTLARANLSFLPFDEMLVRNSAPPRRVGSFGSGSCTHEVSLALAFFAAEVHAYGSTDKYIPKHTNRYFDRLRRLHLELYDFSHPLKVEYDLVFSIQTLEHVEDYESRSTCSAARSRPAGTCPSTRRSSRATRARTRLRADQASALGRLRALPRRLLARRMEERLAAPGFATVDSGYYAYSNGDKYGMKAARQLSGRAEDRSATLLNLGLLSSLTAADELYADRRDEIDDLVQADRVCHAYRILARRS